MIEDVARLLASSSTVALSRREVDEALAFAVEAAEDAGAAILPWFRRLEVVDNKLADGDWDPVTAADRGAEEVLRARIEERYPEHGILGEEFGHRPGNGLTWVLDPVDGTRAFVAGFLHWGLLMALFDGRDPLLGVLHQPVLREFFYGDGRTALYRRGAAEPTPLVTRSCSRLDEAIVCTTHPAAFADDADWVAYQRLAALCRMSRFGGDCYGYAMVAMGQVDLVVESGLHAYDIQALVPVIRGAGGVVTDWEGGNPALGGRVVAAGDERLHALALETLAASREER